MEVKDLKKDWVEYDGDYCKAMQDIRLKNGDEVIKCWPNAGVWTSFIKGKYYQKEIPNNEVTHVRKTIDKFS